VGPLRPGDVLRFEFSLTDGDNIAVNADSLPTATLYQNGTADAATVTITNVVTGAYKGSVTIPSGFAAGDEVVVLVVALVNTIPARFWEGRTILVQWPATALPNVASGGVGGVGDVLRVSGDATAADNCESFFDGTGYAGTGNVIPTVTTVTNLTNAPGAGDFTAAMKTSLNSATPAVTVSDKTGFSLAANQDVRNVLGTLTTTERTAIANEVEAQIIDETDSEKVLTAITDKIASVNPSLSGLTVAAIAAGVRDVSNASPAVGSLGAVANAVKAKTDNLPAVPADESLIIAATDALVTLINDVPTNAELATALGTADDAVLAQVALVKAKTDLIPASPAAVGSAMTVSDKTGFALTSAYDFAKGTVAMTEDYAADGVAPTPAQAFFMMISYLFERSVSGTTMTTKKLDGSTTAMTFTLDSVTPTSVTRAG
jgi:hypothetical protein